MTPSRFRDRLPSDRRYDPQREMWVRFCADGSVEVGATAFGLQLAGQLIAFTPKPRGAEIERGRGLGTIETGKTVLAVHCPVSLRLEVANEDAESNPGLIEHAPYTSGWMIRGTPRNWEDDAVGLVDAAAYRVHCLGLLADAEIEVDQ